MSDLSSRSSRKSRRRNKYKYSDRFRYLVAWTVTVLVSIVFIFAGNRFYSRDLSIFSVADATAERAKVTELGEQEGSSYGTGEDSSYDSILQYFTAELLSGENKGTEVLAVQTWDNISQIHEETVSVGDNVILYNYGTAEGGADWVFGGYSRLDGILVLGAVFMGLLLLFGRIKGFNTIVSLGFTCLAVFCVFLPAVLSGSSIYFITVIVCIYTTIMTLLITNGPTVKSFTTILGCSFGVIVSAILSLIMDKALRLTGLLDEHSIYLTYFDPPVNLHAIIFAMVVIGAMGAVMDVAMDISASLHELHDKAPQLTFAELIRSGLIIGRDVMGTMANTLVLAYIGSSLCSILLMISYSSSLIELLNRESIIVEMMNGLIGSTSILLTIPITSVVCGFVYTGTRFRLSQADQTDSPQE